MKLKWRLAPLRLSIDAEPGLDWERASISIIIAGKVFCPYGAFHRVAGWNGLPAPQVPVGIPIEVRVESPDCAPATIAVVVDGPENPVVVPLRRK